ncbi:MAG: S8 family serine peptidase [Prevotella sp.]|nr:S8 family serine peptidase [Prevotella sp.]
MKTSVSPFSGHVARFFCLLALMLALTSVPLHAQRGELRKMSPFVRLTAIEHSAQRRVAARGQHESQLCAFVRISDQGSEVLRANGCRELARFGNIYIAGIPLSRMAALSADRRVQRIEARERCSLHMDTTTTVVNALPVYAGQGLPQAYTGKGVVIGVQDIGFDLTHPTFYDRTATQYRIRRLWDQLSADTVGSALFVGAEYTTTEALLAYAHSRDGLVESHGTHTAGIAAGSGYDSPYRGMAFESDICLVSNAVSSDTAFIAKDDLYKYTSATDALGFKYIFDYAEERGMPCVVSFSEGSNQDFFGDDVLMYEVLDSLTGPGRILVASAGNEAMKGCHYHKPAGQALGGVFVYRNAPYAYITMRSRGDFLFRFTYYHKDGAKKMLVQSKDVLSRPDSLFIDTLAIGEERFPILIAGYPSIYNPQESAFEVLLMGNKNTFGNSQFPVSVEALGGEADVDFFANSCAFVEYKENPTLKGYDNQYCIHSPGSAPSVICVGATSHRASYYNYLGELRSFGLGSGGVRAPYSSIGPTLDGRTKPDVMAPGSNVVSAYSSYFIENNPDHYDLQQDVARFDFRGRTYSWNSNVGTSMSTPVVSGAIALWLQANPQLSPDDVMQIFSRTCRHYDPTLDYPNNLYGYGEIDVYAGLLEVLGLPSRINGLKTSQPVGASFSMNTDSQLQLRFSRPLSRRARLTVWSMGGARMLDEQLEPGSSTASVSLSHLPQGVYVCQLQGGDSDVDGSTLIRR